MSGKICYRSRLPSVHETQLQQQQWQSDQSQLEQEVQVQFVTLELLSWQKSKEMFIILQHVRSLPQWRTRIWRVLSSQLWRTPQWNSSNNSVIFAPTNLHQRGGCCHQPEPLLLRLPQSGGQQAVLPTR